MKTKEMKIKNSQIISKLSQEQIYFSCACGKSSKKSKYVKLFKILAGFVTLQNHPIFVIFRPSLITILKPSFIFEFKLNLSQHIWKTPPRITIFEKTLPRITIYFQISLFFADMHLSYSLNFTCISFKL